MPKLRNGSTTLETLTQWVARKCCNHDPLQELSKSLNEREKLPGRGKVSALQQRRARDRVSIVDPNYAAEVQGISPQDVETQTITYDSPEGTFLIHIRKASDDDEEVLEKAPRIAVGT